MSWLAHVCNQGEKTQPSATDTAPESIPLLKSRTTKRTRQDEIGDALACCLGVDVRAVIALQSVLALMVLFFVATFASDQAGWFNSGPVSFIDPADPGFSIPKDSHWIKKLLFSRNNPHCTSMQLVASVALSIGVICRVRPRCCLLLLLFLMIFLHGKSAYVQDCGGRLLRHTLFWACLLPCSVAPQNRSLGSKVITGFAAFGVQFQFLYLYWQTLSHRQHASEWVGPDFSAVYYATSGPDYALPLGLLLSRNFPSLCRLLTMGTMAIEVLCPFAPLFIPLHSWWRALPAFALMGLHAGIAMTMNLRHFSILALAICVIYLPTPFWDMVASATPKSGQVDKVETNSFRRICWPCRMHLLREVIAASALAYVVAHMEVFQSQYRGTSLDDHQALYRNTTLDQLWIMYGSVRKEGTYWDIEIDVPDSAGKVDVLKWLTSGIWEVNPDKLSYHEQEEMPTCFSCLYPNMRWEYFLSQTAEASKELQMLRMRAMTRWLCHKGGDGSGLALAEGSIVRFTNHLVGVNPPGSRQHFKALGVQFEHKFACKPEVMPRSGNQASKTLARQLSQ